MDPRHLKIKESLNEEFGDVFSKAFDDFSSLTFQEKLELLFLGMFSSDVERREQNQDRLSEESRIASVVHSVLSGKIQPIGTSVSKEKDPPLN